MPQHLFLSGTARAGTRALARILNQHNHILTGQEGCFKKARFPGIRTQVARGADRAAYKQLCALMPPPQQNTVEDGR